MHRPYNTSDLLAAGRVIYETSKTVYNYRKPLMVGFIITKNILPYII